MPLHEMTDAEIHRFWRQLWLTALQAFANSETQRVQWLDPNQRNTYVNLGFSLALLSQEDEAKKVFGQVLRAGEVLNNLALARELRGDEQGAVKLYAEALDANPRLEVAQDNLEAVRQQIKEDKKETK